MLFCTLNIGYSFLVVVNGSDESTFGDFGNHEIVQEIYDTDIIEQSNSKLSLV